jgi:hypothetical protein
MALTELKIGKWLPKVFLVLLLGCFYIKTIAPDITWANNGADGGDLITAAATGGVAHAPGYPVYLLIAKLFQLIPIGTIAFRTNILSVLCTILAAILIYDLMLRLFNSLKYNWIVGLISAIALGLSPIVWSQAVITEVYALQLFFIVLILYLLPLDDYKFSAEGDKLNAVRGFVFGLAVANHLTAIFLLPLLLLIGIVVRNPPTNNLLSDRMKNNKLTRGWTIQYRSLIFRCIGILVGLSFYLILIIRANSGSPVNWGDPSTISRFFWLVTGKIYSNLLFNFPYGFFLIKLKTFSNILLDQLGIFGMMIAIFGIITNWKKSKKLSLITCWLTCAFVVFSFIYNSADSYLYLAFFNIILTLWLGLGVAKIIESIYFYKPWVSIVIGIVIFLSFVYYGVLTLPKVDASKDNRAEQFGAKVMSVAPKHAIIFTDGDNDSFTLWYYHYVLKERPDIAVIVTNLLPYQWYRDTLKNTYPALIIPNSMSDSLQTTIIMLNSGHPVCYTIVVNEGSIYCKNS